MHSLGTDIQNRFYIMEMGPCIYKVPGVRDDFIVSCSLIFHFLESTFTSIVKDLQDVIVIFIDFVLAIYFVVSLCAFKLYVFEVYIQTLISCSMLSDTSYRASSLSSSPCLLLRAFASASSSD